MVVTRDRPAAVEPALPAVEQPGPHGREVGEDRKRPAGWGDREPVRMVDHRASVNLSSERSQSAEIDAEQKVNFPAAFCIMNSVRGKPGKMLIYFIVS
jgi:hypothetical protein